MSTRDVLNRGVTRRSFLEGSAIAAGGLLAGYGPRAVSAAAEDEEYVVVGALLSIPFWEDPIAGMDRAAEVLGVKVAFIGPDDWNAAQQVTQFQQALIRKPKGVAILPVDPKSVEQIINGALEDGIPVVTADTDAPTSNRLCYLGTDRYQAGVQAADAMAAELEGKGEVGAITLGGAVSLENCLNGFRDRLGEIAPDIEIVTVADGQGKPELITQHTLSMIQGYPDLAGIFSNGTQESSSVAGAVQQAGKGGELVVVGQGATLRTKDVMEAIAKGVVTASVTQRSFQAFYYAIQFLYDLVHGNSADLGLSWYETGISPLPARVDTGTMVITADNVQSFIDKIM